jgi:hypothetical protein
MISIKPPRIFNILYPNINSPGMAVVRSSEVGEVFGFLHIQKVV